MDLFVYSVPDLDIVAGNDPHQRLVSSLAFSPNGSHLAIGGGFNRAALKLLDVTTDRVVRQFFDDLPPYISSLDYSPDGKLLAASSTLQKFCLAWDVTTGRRVFRAEALQRSHGIQVRFAADRRLVTWCPEYARVQWWDLAHGKNTRCWQVPADVRQPSVLSADGRYLACAAGRGAVRSWDLEADRELPSLTRCRGGVRSVALSPAGKALAAGTGDGSVYVLDTTTGEYLSFEQVIEHRVSRLAWCPDGRILAINSGPAVDLMDASNGELLRVGLCQERRLSALAFSRDGKLLACI